MSIKNKYNQLNINSLLLIFITTEMFIVLSLYLITYDDFWFFFGFTTTFSLILFYIIISLNKVPKKEGFDLQTNYPLKNRNDFKKSENGVEEDAISILKSILNEKNHKTDSALKDIRENFEKIFTEIKQNISAEQENLIYSHISQEILINLNNEIEQVIDSRMKFIESQINSNVKKINTTIENNLLKEIDSLYEKQKNDFEKLIKDLIIKEFEEIKLIKSDKTIMELFNKIEKSIEQKFSTSREKLITPFPVQPMSEQSIENEIKIPDKKVFEIEDENYLVEEDSEREFSTIEDISEDNSSADFKREFEEPSNSVELIGRTIDIIKKSEFEEEIMHSGKKFKIQKNMYGKTIEDLKKLEERINKFFKNREIIIVSTNDKGERKYFIYYQI
ncbi:MAG: hypothetical protein ACTSVK_16320 [Promethearchaeota archaeon]